MLKFTLIPPRAMTTLNEHQTRYAIARSVGLPYELAVERTRAALQAEGFGVLTEIDVKATLQKKLGVEFRNYIILGACNPPLAHRGLSAELDLGLLLPCNVIVYQEDPARSRIAILDPLVQLGVTGREDLEPLAIEVRDKLQRALAAI